MEWGLKGPSRVLIMFCFLLWIELYVCVHFVKIHQAYIFFCICVILEEKSIQKVLVALGKHTHTENSLLTFKGYVENKLNILILYVIYHRIHFSES